MMARRLVILLGMVAVGAGMAIVGVAVPASASIIFANCGITGSISGTCPGDTGTSVLHWLNPATGETATTTAVPKTISPAIDLFVTGGNPADFQTGLGVTGTPDNEVNATNYISIKPDNPNSEFATLKIDSLQAGESAVVCPEPNVASIPSASCAGGKVLTGEPVEQTTTIALAPGDVASVTGIGTGDVKIEEFDATVPEPGTLALLVTGMAGLVLVRKRRHSI
jgi:hypothetical protein